MQLRAEAGGSVGCEESAVAGRHVDDARELVPRVRWLGALRLVLGGHSRGPVCVCTLASIADTQLASALAFDRT